ncbi:MAG TPA: cofactor-independent phosphoglycerate mutase [Clostridiales bacterium]|nr:cofactor-independent phosphoglycerate mutase [Clostridiales bacterium]
MKYIVFLGDGMADRAIPELNNRTPLMAAAKPNMDRLAQSGLAGMVLTVPAELAPGSDTANMSVMGYDPRRYYTGRSPLEAISMSIEMEPGDVAFRCNLVTLSDAAEYDDRMMVDYSADEIGSDEAARLIEAVNQHFADDEIRFYPGKSYRHCLIWKNGPLELGLVPPHDILTRRIGEYLPVGKQAGRLQQMMAESAGFLAGHPVNRTRCKNQLKPANSIWIWGQGTKPDLPDLASLYCLKGSVICAVDLIKGLGICAGLHIVEVPGVTGNIHTNFSGKAEAAIQEFRRGQDYVYLHVEAPDECGHRAEIANKVRSIELIDSKIIGPVWDYLEANRQDTGEDYRILVLPDHPTPVSLRTHTGEPVPFACYSSDGRDFLPAQAYDEINCSQTGYFLDEGHQLFARLIRDGFKSVQPE